MRSYPERSASGPYWSNRIDPHGDASRSERDNWIHDFRNALGNTTIAAGAIRGLLQQQSLEQDDIDALMRLVEEGCERCLRLLATMPR